MKNLIKLQLELSKNEQLIQADLINIMGGRKRNKSKYRRDDEYRIMSITYSSDSGSSEVVSDDKRRPRPGGGTTTTSPSSFL
jgi:hypothetical protein